MDTSRLAEFLGSEYGTVLRFSIADAFAECFHPELRSKTTASE
jgi:hypothetical protein